MAYFRFPIRGFSKDFVPAEGGHTGSQSSTQLCVMEALHWSLGNTHAHDRPVCVHHQFTSLFIGLNDSQGPGVRAELIKRVHRLLGTHYLPPKIARCLADKVNHTPPKQRMAALDEVLDSIDEYFEKHNPHIHRLRKEVLPLTNIRANRAAFFKSLNTMISRGGAPKDPTPKLKALIPSINALRTTTIPDITEE